MRISDWSSDVCSSDLQVLPPAAEADARVAPGQPVQFLLRAAAAEQPKPRIGRQFGAAKRRDQHVPTLLAGQPASAAVPERRRNALEIPEQAGDFACVQPAMRLQ